MDKHPVLLSSNRSPHHHQYNTKIIIFITGLKYHNNLFAEMVPNTVTDIFVREAPIARVRRTMQLPGGLEPILAASLRHLARLVKGGEYSLIGYCADSPILARHHNIDLVVKIW